MYPCRGGNIVDGVARITHGKRKDLGEYTLLAHTLVALLWIGSHQFFIER